MLYERGQKFRKAVDLVHILSGKLGQCLAPKRAKGVSLSNVGVTLLPNNPGRICLTREDEVARAVVSVELRFENKVKISKKEPCRVEVELRSSEERDTWKAINALTKMHAHPQKLLKCLFDTSLIIIWRNLARRIISVADEKCMVK